jgi:SP family general alpha glucoside:H+ symporter-like MFS transporter
MDVLTPGVDDKHQAFPTHLDDPNSVDKYHGLSEVQKTLAVAADREKSTSFGTFTAIKYYWVAFLWSQYASFGTVLVGYDGSVAGAVISVPAFRQVLGTEINGEYVISAAWQVSSPPNASDGVDCIGRFQRRRSHSFDPGILLLSVLGRQAWVSPFTVFLLTPFRRRGCLLFGCIVSIAAIFLEFFVIPGQNVMWFFGKFINGIAGSIFASTSSSYAIEVSPLKLRGVTTGVVNMYISVGQL